MATADNLQTILSSSPDVMSGRTVFRGTRVPLEALVDNLASGMSLDEVLDSFPTLDLDDVKAVLTTMSAALVAANVV